MVTLNAFFQTAVPTASWSGMAQVLTIVLLLLLAGAVTIFSKQIGHLIVRMLQVSPSIRRATDERKRTLERLFASLVSVTAFVIVIVLIMRMFVESSQIIWIIGLFSAAFGLGARGVVSDLLAGASFISRNTFAMDEKVEMVVGMNRIEGVVEDVNMRTTQLRAASGELYTLPNGEIGVIRNFTRAAYSGAELKVKVATEQLMLAIHTLETLGVQAMSVFPDQLEPWKVLVTDNVVGTSTEVTIHAKYRFGQAAVLKPQVAALIYDGLTSAGVTVVD
jgi:small conductance mechanosensitive channel